MNGECECMWRRVKISRRVAVVTLPSKPKPLYFCRLYEEFVVLCCWEADEFEKVV
jgi:hypothetical protein